ncbi:hypothetical protein [Oceanicola sp. S124]|uniref:hypothetical protein n=1 Tax=Oceanicola sp. S124 TaxID=1042378 RepID=UPI0002ED181F|nr:hypothetical protein [Oceanicola sp. S124]
MDPVNLVYYAVICAGLSGLSPRLRTLPLRLAVGALVGLVAAGLLPQITSALGV